MRVDGCSSVSLGRVTGAEACLRWFLKGRLDFRLKPPRSLSSNQGHGWPYPLSSVLRPPSSVLSVSMAQTVEGAEVLM